MRFGVVRLLVGRFLAGATAVDTGPKRGACAVTTVAARTLHQRRFSVRMPTAQKQDPDALMRILPPKPEAPSNDDCCLSGCEFCVWDLYDEDMREYQKQAGVIRQVFEEQGREIPEQLRPENIHDAVDPAMRAFLDMERDMAMKIQQEEDDNSDGD